MRCYKLFLILNLICFSTSCFNYPNKIKPQNNMKLIAYNQIPSRIITPTEKKNETRLFIFIYLKTMF